MKQRILNLLIALDQFIFVLITLGGADPDETISAALFRMEQQHKIAGRLFRPVVDFLFSPIEKDHCHSAYLSEFKKLQLPQIYRT